MTDKSDDGVYDTTGRRRFLSSGRLVGAGIAVVAALGLGVAFALTGSDDSAGGGSDSATGEDSGGDAAEADAALAYAECMRENGLEDWPDPVVEEDPRRGLG